MNQHHLPIALFNGPIVTTNGLYRIHDIDVDTAKRLIQKHGFISAIGHEATAQIMSDLFDMNIPMNRIQFHQDVHQLAIAFKLKERPEEGVILSIDELESIGYGLKLMERLK